MHLILDILDIPIIWHYLFKFFYKNKEFDALMCGQILVLWVGSEA